MEPTLIAVLKGAERRKLPWLLIGGNAVILLGFARNTIDVDLLVPAASRPEWLDLMRELNFQLYHGTASFAQFEPGAAGFSPVDLMFVDDATWMRLESGATEREMDGMKLRIPKPLHMVALKLHAAGSSTREKPETDWEDIRQILRITGLDLADEEVRETILRYAGEVGLRRLESFKQ